MSDSAFEMAFERVQQLAATFKANELRYLASDYQEAEARKDFIDKFWTALGWDVNHDRQTNPYEQEVKVERSVSAGGQRRADYAFYLAPNYRDVRFFVEAKKPAVEIASKENYFQLIRYGWSSETPLAVLTDFEQFHILDCRYKPDVDTALNRAAAKFHYSEYHDRKKFAEIYWLFSREAVADGSLEKRAKEMPKPRGKAVQRGLFSGAWKSIDESFLEDLDEYRTGLAKAFKNKNPKLDSEQLTEATQRALDRLVFIRFLEDKGIEAQRLVDKFGDKGTAWEDFIAVSRRLDGIYNGIVFKDHPLLDRPGLRVDDDVVAGICKKLAHVNSPYDFNAIPIHILGSIYERFLGKIITATDKRVRVEEKPEVRKAGGVYYTPEYIVRYIVENTVGKLVAGKTPDQIAEMRFADIACGSGSFLLGVYDLLLTYHGNYYNQNPGKAKKGDCIERDGKQYLSLKKKREILLNNIYGVDIDAQAVEVCQLSLYLKLLKDESEFTTQQFFDFEKQALLPSLNKNIVCGNSLIGTDILDGQLFASDEERKLNPMNFEDAFPHIFRRQPGMVREPAAPYGLSHEGGRRWYPESPSEPCGFDAIVGNPPYILLQILDQPHVFRYLSENYRAARYKIDTYHVFIERALALTKPSGRVGYITPNSFLRNKHARELRHAILEQANVELLRLFQYQVFHGANVDTAVTILERAENPAADHQVQIVSSKTPEDTAAVHWQTQAVWQRHSENHFGLPGAPGSEELQSRIREKSRLLGEFATAYFGIQTFDREKFVSRKKHLACHQPVIDGENIGRYSLQPSREFVEFRPPAIKSGGNPQVYSQPRIGVRQIGREPIATFLPANLFTLNTIYNIFFTKQTTYDLKFILGIVGSKVVAWYWRQCFYDQKETFPKIKKDALLAIPVPRINVSDAPGKVQHDAVVAKVEAMLAAKQALAGAQTDKDRTYYENKCAGLDRQIDRLVYELYGLTEDEIRIVEGTTK